MNDIKSQIPMLYNCTFNQIKEELLGHRIIVFGIGSYLKVFEDSELSCLIDDIAYCVDNSSSYDNVKLAHRTIQVLHPDKLRLEKNCVILLNSPLYMYDMYIQLLEMGLDESVVCYAIPFILLESDKEYNMNYSEEEGMIEDRTHKIPKVIHSFWFSGEEKPDLYKKCIESWYLKCPDYEVKEWSLSNYNNRNKNEFFEAAIDARAWAFASDYARLDVIDEFGGIYLDMDVEVFKPFDRLLSLHAFFSFSNPAFINLAEFGAKKGHPLLKKMMDLYEDVEIPKEREGFKRFYQPGYVKTVFKEAGAFFDGKAQKISMAQILPSTYLMPLEVVCLEEKNITNYTSAIHYDNFGWSTGRSMRDKKIEDNRKLKKMIQQRRIKDER